MVPSWLFPTSQQFRQMVCSDQNCDRLIKMEMRVQNHSPDILIQIVGLGATGFLIWSVFGISVSIFLMVLKFYHLLKRKCMTKWNIYHNLMQLMFQQVVTVAVSLTMEPN